MLFTLKDIQDYNLRAQDGDFGKIHAFMVDDSAWTIRYLVVEVGSRKVLLSVMALGEPDTSARVLPVRTTREQIMNSPEIDFDRPLTRDMERRISDYFDWPYYWDPTDVPNTLPGDLTAVPLIDMELDRQAQELEQNPELIPQTGRETTDQVNEHLLSTKDLFGAAIHATNDGGNAGKLVDLVTQNEDWNVLYMIVDTGGLLSGKKTLISPTWVERVDRRNSRIDINLREETIRESPEYNSILDLTQDYQARLKSYFDDL